MNNQIVTAEVKPSPPVGGGWYGISTKSDAMQISQMLAGSQLVPPHFKGKKDDVYLAILFGATLGLNAWQSVQNIAVINGKPSLWGDSILALIQSHPEYRGATYNWDDAKKNWTITLRREAHGVINEVTMSFGMDDARLAKLDSRDTYKSYPKDMCFRRCYGKCAKALFADVLNGIAIAEEERDYADTKKSISSVTITDAEKKVAESMGMGNVVEGVFSSGTPVAPAVAPEPTQAAESPEVEAVKPQAPASLDKITYLNDLWEQYMALDIPNKKIEMKQKWLDTAKVDSISKLSDVQLDACVFKLENMLDLAMASTPTAGGE